MLRTTLQAAWSRKRRLVGTALAIVIGVAFLTASLVMGDSARAGFRSAFTEANAGTDAFVRSASQIDADDTVTTAPIDASLLDVVRAVDGVAAVAPSVDGIGQVLDADGEPIGGDGPPTMAANWIDDPELTGWQVVEGAPPAGPGEVAIDRGTAETADLGVGDQATILVPDAVTATVTGIIAFGDDDSIGGSTLVAFETATAQELLLGSTERLTGVVVHAAAGVGQDELVARIEQVLPDGVEAITGADLTAEQEDAIERDFLGFFNTALLIFAFVALLVAAFSIFNTFSILVAQRTRESALLRALGASRRQVLASALGEAVIIGVLGSVLGLGAGVLVAKGMLALMERAGFGLPTDGTVLTGGSITLALVVGIVVTVLGGLAPAVRASRVAPLAALREVAIDGGRPSRRRTAAGLVAAGVGVALVLSGTSGEGGMSRAGLGAVVLVVGIVLVGPFAAGPAGALLGAPLALRGVSGRLARRNAVRNPRRTAGTAAALLVGVGVVALFTVFGASVSRSIEEQVDRSFAGDLAIQPSSWGGAGLSPGLLDDVAALPEVAAVAGMGYGGAVVDGRSEGVGYTDPEALTEVLDLHVTEGGFDALAGAQLAMSVDYAAERGYSVGDVMEIGFADGATVPMELTTLFDDGDIGGDVLLPIATWRAHNVQTNYFIGLVSLADGVSVDEGRDALASVTAGRGGTRIQDADEYVESEAAEIDTVLNVIYGMLAIAILIALMGIANTLSLSVHERTRELGLLRAVGQSRAQLRSMVRWESVVVATFGAVGGVGLGVFLGWGLVRALNAAEGFGTLAIPYGSLVGVLVIGAMVGVLAGLRPAWRAAKLDVLAAVAAD